MIQKIGKYNVLVSSARNSSMPSVINHVSCVMVNVWLTLKRITEIVSCIILKTCLILVFPTNTLRRRIIKKHVTYKSHLDKI